MPSQFVPRSRKVRILATLGPASNTPEMIRMLAEAGADAFRINMSHGTHADHKKLIEIIRGLEKELERPTTILADLQGPKLRVGKFAGDRAEVAKGDRFAFDRDKKGAVFDADHGLVDLAPGEYIAYCPIPSGTTGEESAGDGPPHFTQGMLAEFTVS